MSDGATTSAPARAWESGDPSQQRKGCVVVDLSVPDHSAVAVSRVFVEADVRQDQEVGDRFLEPSGRLLNRSRVVPCLAARRRPCLRDPEEDDRGNPEVSDRARLGEGLVRGEAADARQGRDLFAQTLAVPDEERSHEAIGDSRVSRTRARIAGVRRSRRIRIEGNEEVIGGEFSRLPKWQRLCAPP